MPKEVSRWEEVIGNKYRKEMIINAIQRDVLSSFILFDGGAGIGKSTFAKMTAKTILCTNRDENGYPCGRCKNCLEVEAGGNGVAYKKYNMPTLIKKSDVNETISEIFQIKKLSDKTVYVLEEIHGLSKELQTLLLEELTKIPKDVYIISCTTRSYDLLPEIRNRALQIKLIDPTEQECLGYAKRLADSYGINVISDKAIKALVERCEFSPRKISEVIRVVSMDNKLCEDTLANIFGTVGDEVILEYIDAVMNPNNNDLYQFVSMIDKLQEETNLYQLNRQALDMMFEYILHKGANVKDSGNIRDDVMAKLNGLFSSVSMKDLVATMKAFGDLNLKESEAKSTQKAKLVSMKSGLGVFEPVVQARGIPIIKNRIDLSNEFSIKSDGLIDINLPSNIEGIFTEMQFGDEFRRE